MSDSSPSSRAAQLVDWIATQTNDADFAIEAASEDASFRRYFRIVPKNTPFFGQKSLIAMDAPPDKENSAQFVHVAQLMHTHGVNAPHIFAQDTAQGFLLIQDFGDVTYQDALARGDHAGKLYSDALHALVRWQKNSRCGDLPDYDETLLRRELMLFPEWYAQKHKNHVLSVQEQKTFDQISQRLIAAAQAQEQVFVHRDYHVRNLMVLDENNPGILDFQDAVYGPITYDLVSLLRDAYIDWDEEQQIDWAIRYWEIARAEGVPVPVRFDEFWREFEWMGVQRHLKIAGIFARLYHRDGKDAYLNDLPRVMRYLRKTTERYAELSPLLFLLDTLEQRVPQVGYTF
jgi:Predicted phosphotransferase related to Ser/Thr protein kinases